MFSEQGHGHKTRGYLGGLFKMQTPGPIPDLGVGIAGLGAWKSAHTPAPSGKPHKHYRPGTLMAGLGWRGNRG